LLRDAEIIPNPDASGSGQHDDFAIFRFPLYNFVVMA